MYKEVCEWGVSVGIPCVLNWVYVCVVVPIANLFVREFIGRW